MSRELIAERESNPWCAAATTRHEGRVGETLTTDLVMEVATAARMLDWRVMWDSQQRERGRTLVSKGWGFLKSGQVLEVSKASKGWNRQLCLVLARSRASGPVRLEFTTLPNWIRDGRL